MSALDQLFENRKPGNKANRSKKSELNSDGNLLGSDNVTTAKKSESEVFEIKIKSKKEKLKEKKLRDKMERKTQKISTNVQQTQIKAKLKTVQTSDLIEVEESSVESIQDVEEIERLSFSSTPEPEIKLSDKKMDTEEKVKYSDKKKKKTKKPTTNNRSPEKKKSSINSTKEVLKNEEIDNWEEMLSDDEEIAKGFDQPELLKLSGRKSNPLLTKETTEEMIPSKEEVHLRSPICCILGHVDTGKTKLLDNIRQTNVQGQEHGGITQQIGATYMPLEAIRKRTSVLGIKDTFEYKIPGLLVIDTPGHESFSNLRSRGSSLCNIAILVVDITHGLEPQTIESLNLLRQRKTPFIVALNKIDRLYGWESPPNIGLGDALKMQKEDVKRLYNDKVQQMMLEFSEQGFNTELYYKNKNMSKYISLVPTSAFTGVGVSDLLQLLIHLTQSRMSSQLTYQEKVQCTVLEVKVTEGVGTTLDVILVNGILKEGQTIVVCGLNGPIVTQIRALLTPQPMKEMRVKSQYINNKEIKAAMGVRVCGENLENCIAGCRLLVSKSPEDIEELKQISLDDFQSMEKFLDKSGRGVYVQASTLGSLEALLTFLNDMKIPVFQISIGPIHKKDVMKASIMMEHNPEYAVMLCFDVKADKDVLDLAEELGITIFQADIIYHLFDKFTEYHQSTLEKKRKEQAPKAVFPCILKTLAAFNKRDPIILGVDVVEGVLRVGTPLCVMIEVLLTYLGGAFRDRECDEYRERA
eukprot:NODE_41_length_34096_cov_2.002235.p3 type:complete len:751 gc:universal NODE_41_length_34096_cov_2.002235:21247-23499(+)